MKTHVAKKDLLAALDRHVAREEKPLDRAVNVLAARLQMHLDQLAGEIWRGEHFVSNRMRYFVELRERLQADARELIPLSKAQYAAYFKGEIELRSEGGPNIVAKIQATLRQKLRTCEAERREEEYEEGFETELRERLRAEKSPEDENEDRDEEESGEDVEGEEDDEATSIPAGYERGRPRDLGWLELNARVLKALKGGDILTVDQLTECTAQQLLDNVGGFGKTSLGEVRVKLTLAGLSLKED